MILSFLLLCEILSMFTNEIARGLSWLNHNRRGWLNSVNLQSLNMRYTDRCMLRQTRDHDGFDKTMYDYDLTWEDMRRMGFSIDHTDPEADVKYNILTNEWKETVKLLRQQEQEILIKQDNMDRSTADAHEYATACD